jgi:hypothetical protein
MHLVLLLPYFSERGGLLSLPLRASNEGLFFVLTRPPLRRRGAAFPQ